MPAKKVENVDGFTAEEQAAMKDRAAGTQGAVARGDKARADSREGRAGEDRRDGRAGQGPGDSPARTGQGARPHDHRRPPYGMPAYTRDGKVVLFFHAAGKFKTRYATLGFSDQAAIDDGPMWPTTLHGLTAMGAAPGEPDQGPAEAQGRIG